MCKYEIYCIKIANKQSHFNGCIYIGRHKISDKAYFGSGNFIREYQKRFGTHGMKKYTIEMVNSEELSKMREIYWIKRIRNLYPYRCINIARGG